MTMNRWGEADRPEAESSGYAQERLFRALAEPARLAIVKHLFLGEHRVAELTEHIGLAQSTTSAHLTVLRECGLVSVRTDGRSSVYSLSAPAELETLFAAAILVASATGDLPAPVVTPIDPGPAKETTVRHQP